MFQNRILKIAKEHGAMSLKLLQNLYTKLITEFVNKIKKKGRKKEIEKLGHSLYTENQLLRYRSARLSIIQFSYHVT